jgi:predicted nuclease of predicted toxin-antitoxin system
MSLHFLVDTDLPRRPAEIIRQYGYEASDVREIGLGSAPDTEIAAFAKLNNWVLLTGDFGFADIRNYPPEQYSGIVVLTLPKNATATVVLELVEVFMRQKEVLDRLPGRLAVVDIRHVRLRPHQTE